MGEHTPGPWELPFRLDRHERYDVLDDNDVVIATVWGSEADARLLAAAPDLLAALQRTWCASTRDDHFIGGKKCPICQDAAAAIAKATGVQEVTVGPTGPREADARLIAAAPDLLAAAHFNARLISAAPDLLAALQGLMPLAECGAEQSECAASRDDYKRELDAGYAAIAKATGEQVTT